MSVFKLFALLPPSNIETKIISIKKKIFSEFGLSSSLALPAFIPLFFIHEDFKVHSLHKVLDGYKIKGFSCATDKIIQQANSFYLLVNSRGRMEELKKDIIKRLNSFKKMEINAPSDSLFPPAEGFFLVNDEEKFFLMDLQKKLQLPETISFNSFSVTLIKIDTPSPRKFWEKVYWEMPFELKSRKGS